MKRILFLIIMVFATYNISFGQNLIAGHYKTGASIDKMDISDDGSIAAVADNSAKQLEIYKNWGSHWGLQKSFSLPHNVTSVSVSGDGKTIAVGMGDYLLSNAHFGEVRIYKENNNSWSLSSGGTLVGARYTNGNFGSSLDLSDDGKWLVVGSPGTKAGSSTNNYYGRFSIYEFTSSWTLKRTQNGPSNSIKKLGTNVAISGDGSKVAIATSSYKSAPEVSIYKKYTNTYWSQLGSTITGSSNIRFSHGLDISDNGNRIIIGANLYSNNKGRVYIYDYTTNWNNTETIDGQNNSEQFGRSVSLSGDGSRFIASVYGLEKIRLYQKVSSGWIQVGNDATSTYSTSGFGEYVRISSDGMKTVASNSAHFRYFTNPTTCVPPSGMTTSNLAATSTTLDWSKGDVETSWDIQYHTSVFSAGSSVGTSISASTTPTKSITGLTPETTYYVKYRANCGSEQSGWVDASFTTLPTCPVPSAMVLDSVSTETAILSWTVGDAETQWNIEWKAGNTIFSPGTGAADGSVVATTNTSQAITGLSMLTNYTLYYQADCGGGDESDWVGPFTFSTKNKGDGTASVVPQSPSPLFSTSGVNMMQLGNDLVFVSSSLGLCKFDGTTITPILDPSGVNITSPNSLTILNGELFFKQYTISGYVVLKYNGTSVSEIQDINGNSVNANEFKIIDNTIYTYYGVWDYSTYLFTSYFVKYNGTYFEDVPNVSINGSFTVYNGAFYYLNTSGWPYKLHKNDNGTDTEVKANGVSYSSSSTAFQEYDSKLIITGNNETWITDGTTTTELTYNNTTITSAKSFVEFNGDLIFTASIGGSNYLCIYDGTSVTTVSTSNSSLPISNVKNLTEVDGVLYFTATDATHGNEWRKYENGIATLLVDADGASFSSIPTNVSGNMVAGYNGSVFFSANNGSDGLELWKHDGTTAYMVQDINTGSGDSKPTDMIEYDDKLYFVAENGSGRQLMFYEEVPDSASITFSKPIACLNDSALFVPITINDISSDLGAISLVFDYDVDFMTYDKVANTHTNLNAVVGTNFYINDYNGKMYISWASTNAATVADGDTLFTLKFLPKNAPTFTTASSTLLTWDKTNSENCELSDGLQVILPGIYSDSVGRVTALPVANLGSDLTNSNTLCELETATFTASGGATYEFFVNNISQAVADTTSTYNTAALLDNDVVRVMVIDENGCYSEDSMTIVVRELPNILLTNDNTDNRICSGDVVNFKATGASKYTFYLNNVEVQPQSIDSTYSISPISGDVIRVEGINTNTGCENDGDQDYTLLLDGCYGTSGSIVYKNTAETPMGNVSAKLMAVGIDTSTTLTEVNLGIFNFTQLYDNASYVFSATTNKTHGGINSTDALGIIQHAINVSSFTGLELKAADVDGIGGVNATDALLVMQRFVQSINSFGAGDWVFEDKSYIMTTDFTNEKVYSLAMGDVNGSYTPNISESASVILASSQTIKPNSGDVITLPVTVANTRTIGAMSIAFNFPSHLMTINNVSLANGGNVLFNVQGDELRIAWADATAMQLSAGDVLFNIEATINNAADLANYPITSNNISEIANDLAVPYSNITLEIPTFEATTGINGVETAAIPVRNFPNPFSTLTTIEYVLPSTSNVILTIRNATGSEVRTIVNELQTAGKQQATIDASDLSTGTYFYTITVQEANRSYTVTKRMVVIK
ncbi:MAG: T9SS type A sorting domain-containing protein [Saprospiraceae bacterium]